MRTMDDKLNRVLDHLEGENERLRRLILSWANDINWAAEHAGCRDKFSPITESMKKEALK